MTINQLASKLTIAEDGKSEAKIGDVRQILKLLAIEIKKDPIRMIILLLS